MQEGHAQPRTLWTYHGPHWFEPLGWMGAPHVQHGIVDVVRPDGREPDMTRLCR